MKESNTANRLKEIMNERNLKQIDILNACLPYCKKYNVKMSKSDISQYVSGKVDPGQDKLFVLGNALNVSEAWLMGFDVPKERTSPLSNNSPSPSQPIIMSYFDQLNTIGQETATEQVRLLTLDPKYTKRSTSHIHSTSTPNCNRNITPFTNVAEAKRYLQDHHHLAAFNHDAVSSLTDSDILKIANELRNNS